MFQPIMRCKRIAVDGPPPPTHPNNDIERLYRERLLTLYSDFLNASILYNTCRNICDILTGFQPCISVAAVTKRERYWNA